MWQPCLSDVIRVKATIEFGRDSSHIRLTGLTEQYFQFSFLFFSFRLSTASYSTFSFLETPENVALLIPCSDSFFSLHFPWHVAGFLSGTTASNQAIPCRSEESSLSLIHTCLFGNMHCKDRAGKGVLQHQSIPGLTEDHGRELKTTSVNHIFVPTISECLSCSPSLFRGRKQSSHWGTILC